jgi:hypothetical protein
MALTPYQVLFILYVQQCLNAGIQYTKDAAIAFAVTKLMAPMKTWPPVDFSQATGTSQGLSEDWDYLVDNNLLPTQPNPLLQPNSIPLSQWVLDATGKNLGIAT